VFGSQARDSSLVRRFLTNRAVVYTGVVSYGIYLWHDPWIDRYLSWSGLPTFTVYGSDVPFAWHTSRLVSVPFFTMTLAVLALTVAAATLSWFLLERPVLRLKRLPNRALTRRATLARTAGLAPPTATDGPPVESPAPHSS
jgi:peptidoglycan/LPS O-acetylase OafA/YrhL